METQTKRMKQKKSEKQGFDERRSPLQHFNGLQFHRSNSQKTSNLSSSSSSEASTVCLRFLLSSTNSSHASLASSSSSRTHLERKPKTFSRATNNLSVKSSAVASNVKPRSKENEVSRKPFSEKSKKNQQPCLHNRQCGKTNVKTSSKTDKRSELFRGQVKILKGRSGELAAKSKSSQEIGSVEQPVNRFGVHLDWNLSCTKSCTPQGKIACVSLSDSMSFDGCQNVGQDSVSKTGNGYSANDVKSVSKTGNGYGANDVNLVSKTGTGYSANDVKTPPVEASASPEIQCASHSKMLVLKSAATPVCYGAGHLLSGVTDKRKRRRRGSLRGGCEKVNLFDDEGNDGNMISNSQDSSDSSIPLLAEASVRWLLSPCDEGLEDQGGDSEIRLGQCKTSRGSASLALDLQSSTSSICGNVSDLGCENSSFSVDGSVGNAECQRKARIVELCPRKNTEVKCSVGPSNKKMCEPLLAATPNSTFNCNSVSSGEGRNVRQNVIENNSAFSLGSSSSGNIIRTPSSDSSSYRCAGGSNGKSHHRDVAQFELDSVTQTLNAMSMSPGSEMLIRDAPSLSFQHADLGSSSSFIIPVQLQKNVNSVCSWVSDSTVENLSLSQMRISWRDGLVCKTDENDEFDCCPCLSDEEIDAVACSGKQPMWCRPSLSGGDKENDLATESGENEDNALKMDNDISPILLDYEPCIPTQGKEKSSEDRLNAFAESICTNGSDVAASCDSDRTYLGEDPSFRIS